jgi:hypothetical protein
VKQQYGQPVTLLAAGLHALPCNMSHGTPITSATKRRPVDACRAPTRLLHCYSTRTVQHLESLVRAAKVRVWAQHVPAALANGAASREALNLGAAASWHAPLLCYSGGIRARDTLDVD